jgi:hypothetical protein
MFNYITYYMIGGFPIIMYWGIVTLFLLLFTAAISVMNKKGINKIGFKWHPRVAFVTIAFAIVHALMGILSYI